MTLNHREKMIAATVGVALVALLAVNFLLLPYLDARQKLNRDIASAAKKQHDNKDLLNNQSRVTDQWKLITVGANSPLKTDPAQGSQSMNEALQAWATQAGFELKTVKQDHFVQKGDFQQVRFTISGSGGSRNLGHFLLAMEKSNLPLSIDELRLNARKEGVDDVLVQMVLTTAVFSPSTATRPGQRVAPKGDNL